MTILSYALEVLNALPGLISAGVDVYDFINTTNDNIKKMQDENRDPTDQEWSDLNQLVEALRAQRPDVTGE